MLLTKNLTIALTGSRFSGKNGVCKLFKQIGVPVFDADAILKYLINYNGEVLKSVKKILGRDFVMDDYVNPIAFDTDDKFEKLLNIVEFELFESFNRFTTKHDNSQYVIFHSSLIFEKGWQNRFDKVINVFTPKEDRIFRYKIETDQKIESINKLFGRELNEIIKNKMSDYVIHNYQDAPNIVKQVNNIDSEIIELYLTNHKKSKISDISLDDYSHSKNILL